MVYIVRLNYLICRQKFHSVESEATKGTEVLKDKLGSIKGKVQEALEEASRSDIAKKAGECRLKVSQIDGV
jgi:import inner membrane translocase subunit TIM44